MSKVQNQEDDVLPDADSQRGRADDNVCTVCMRTQVEVQLEETHASCVMTRRCTCLVQKNRRCRLPVTGGLDTCIHHASTCSVCLNKNNKESLTLSCGHAFHTQCIQKWFETVRRCPMCRHYEKPSKIHIMYQQNAPRLDHSWVRPIIEQLVERELLLTDRVTILSTGELIQSNGDFITFLWGN